MSYDYEGTNEDGFWEDYKEDDCYDDWYDGEDIMCDWEYGDDWYYEDEED